MRDQLLARFQAALGRAPTVIARAPGRIEFIGNHTDYNGGTVLGAAIDRSLWVGLASRDDARRRFGADYAGNTLVEVAADRIDRKEGNASWVNYPLGILDTFREFGLRTPTGFDLYVISDLPSGAGLSSSAALELASALVFAEATSQQIGREQLVEIGRHAENHFVGVPCGILDQSVCGFGKKDHLVFIDCRGPQFSTVPLPPEARFWIFNTHTKHALVDGFYAERNRECMQAAQVLGVGQLAELTPKLLAEHPAKRALPATAARRAQHVVEEIARVDAVRRALHKGDLRTTGALLTASHRSSQHLFENSTPELNFLVDTLTTAPGVYGARLTGGGFGGAVMALTSAQFSQGEADKVALAYREKFGGEVQILEARTADGASLVA